MIILRYLAVGGVAAGIDIGIFVIFAKMLGLNYLLVAATGFVLATCVNYVLSVRFAFTSGIRFGRSMEIALVYLVSLVGLVINQGVLYVGIELIGVEMVLCKLIATGLVFVWNYGVRSRFVFRSRIPGN